MQITNKISEIVFTLDEENAMSCQCIQSKDIKILNGTGGIYIGCYSQYANANNIFIDILNKPKTNHFIMSFFNRDLDDNGRIPFNDTYIHRVIDVLNRLTYLKGLIYNEL